MLLSRTTLVSLAALIALLMAAFSAPDVLPIGAFSTADPAQDVPARWEPLTFRDGDKRTEYELVQLDSTVAVKATSDGGASGLVTRRAIDLNTYPILEWRWKVDRVLDAGDATKKSGDDYPARIYVTFDYDGLGFGGRMKRKALQVMGYDDIPTRALNYLWASSAPRGEFLPNPYTDWVMMLPVQSGSEHVGTWQTERRNVLEDYRAAFGEDPPPVNGIAIMTDTDDTGESATAYYGDIVFKRAPNDTSGDTATATSQR